MDIGERLREIRQAQGLSQREIEERSGLLRDYVSKIENGHAIPTLQVLERWAKALGVELRELFVVGNGQPEAAESPERIPVGSQERTLLELFGQLSVEDRSLLISLARDMVKRKGEAR